MKDCIFCKIINKEIPANIVYEDEYMMAFYDINKKAKVHLLLIPKIHISNLNEVNENNIKYINHIMLKIKDIAKMVNINESGYRIGINNGEDSGQEVYHLHFHMLGGEKL